MIMRPLLPRSPRPVVFSSQATSSTPPTPSTPCIRPTYMRAKCYTGIVPPVWSSLLNTATIFFATFTFHSTCQGTAVVVQQHYQSREQRVVVCGTTIWQAETSCISGKRYLVPGKKHVKPLGLIGWPSSQTCTRYTYY